MNSLMSPFFKMLTAKTLKTRMLMKKSTILLLPVLAWFLSINVASATEIQELVDQNRLSLSTSIETIGPIVAKQPVTIAIKISTDRWFVGGNKVEEFDLVEAVVLPMSELAINGIERINGQTWATQVREITFYPMQEGIYQIPSLSVDIAVNSTGIESVRGRLQTEPIEVNVVLPYDLKQYKDYVVTNSFEIDVSGKFSSKEPAQVGDAVVRTVTFTAENIPSMMLPEMPKVELKGVSIYQKPPILRDEQPRTILTGIREDSYTYFFEAPGTFTIPAQDFYWWNIDTQQLETITVPSETWTVEGEALTTEDVSGGNSWLPTLNDIYRFLFLLVSIFIITFVYRRRTLFSQLYRKVTKKEFRVLKQKYLSAVKVKNFPNACKYLYKIYDTPFEKVDALMEKFKYSEQQQALLANLLALSFYDNDVKASFSVADAKELLKAHTVKADDVEVNIKSYINLNR